MRTRLSLSVAAPPRAGVWLPLAAAVAAVVLLAPGSAAAGPRPGDAGPGQRDAAGVPRIAAAASASAHPSSTGDSIGALADRLTRRLGDRSAGAFLDPVTGQLVVTVVGTRDAALVRAAGAQARLVRYTGRQLQRVKSRLDRAAAVPGTAWSVDPVHNAVTVSVPRGPDDARTAAFLRSLAGHGDLVRVERIAGAPVPQAFHGGQSIDGGTVQCSAGFNAVRGGSHYVLTAGHCSEASLLWTSGALPVGTTSRTTFPGSDYGVIAMTLPITLDPEPYIRSGDGLQRITRSGRVPIGAAVCKTGGTSGTTCGTVRRYGVTVNYSAGRVFGLTQTTVCTQGGDSGGGLFAGNSAQGLVSGATPGPCGVPGFQSYFQPVDEVLRATGLRLL